ncbi:MAG: hypothetical protein L6437_10450 [Kiritimatiellae bacterium]|nr:hypothetical protein [Verrucomicrobiota bacterium]MBU4365713.1 hypothetical protein [Verrucomicrobiota bacterium]MCG2660650.1 hypothetical protein [Kiritimatiellia bacterium]
MNARQIVNGVYWMGAQDWNRRLFDALIPLPKSTPGYTTGGLQWGPYGRSANPKLEPVGVTEDMLGVARHHGIHIARAAKALKGVKIFG